MPTCGAAQEKNAVFSFFSAEISPLFTEEKNKKKLSVAMKLLYLDAIVTVEGKQRLNELKEKYQYNNI